MQNWQQSRQLNLHNLQTMNEDFSMKNKMDKMSPGMTESRARQGLTTPASEGRGYPKMPRFNPYKQEMMGEMPKADNDGRQLPAQGNGKETY